MTDEELNALMADMDRRASAAFDADARKADEKSARTPSMLVRETMMSQTTDEDEDDAAQAEASDLGESDDATDDYAHEDGGVELEASEDDGAQDDADEVEASDSDVADDDGDDASEGSEDEDAYAAADDADFKNDQGQSGDESLMGAEDGDGFADKAEDDDAPLSLRVPRSERREDEAAASDPDEGPRVSLRVQRPSVDDAIGGPEEGDGHVSLRVQRPAFDDAGDGPEEGEGRVSLRLQKPAVADDAETAESGEPRVSLRVERPVTSRSISQRRADVAHDAVRPADADERKPRVMLMGEFSAGKSTLMNLLLGEPALPTNTTATQLPPVWITKGNDAQAVRVDLEGFEEPVDLASRDIPIADTHYIRLQKQADLLDICDLIDTPGISDPNMPAEVWQRMVQHADVVIWCTHATQAWRQSEAAAWAMMPQKLRKRSLLLLTRFDKVPSDRDRIRVLKRVRNETDEVFRDIFPISLTDAIAAGDDKDAFAAAGGESFADALFEVIGLIQRKDTSVRTRPRSQVAPFKLEPEPEPARVVTPRRVRPRPLAARPLTSRSNGLHRSH